MKPKLADIARNLQVSTATVSLALSGKGRVSPDMVKRIREEAAKLDYRPDQNGKALRTGRNDLIGLVLPDVSNALFPRMARAITLAAEERGYGVLIADSRDSTRTQDEALRRLVDLGSDGLVVIPRKGTEIGPQPIPVAVIDAPGAPQNMVSADHAGGGALLMTHLQDHGHRNMLCIGENRSSLVQRTRISGMLSVLREDARAPQLWLEDEPDILAEIENGVTALCCTSDISALRLLMQLGRAGVAVPQQVSITGFDNLDIGQMINPKLTTVATSESEIGGLVIDRLIGLINGAAGDWGDVVPMSLVPGETVSHASNRERGDEHQ